MSTASRAGAGLHRTTLGEQLSGIGQGDCGADVDRMQFHRHLTQLLNGADATGESPIGKETKDLSRHSSLTLSLIKVAQRLGNSPQKSGSAFPALPKHAETEQRDWERLSRQGSLQLDTRIDPLTALRNQLADCISCDCLSVNNRPLHSPDDELGRKGSGPRLRMR